MVLYEQAEMGLFSMRMLFRSEQLCSDTQRKKCKYTVFIGVQLYSFCQFFLYVSVQISLQAYYIKNNVVLASMRRHWRRIDGDTMLF